MFHKLQKGSLMYTTHFLFNKYCKMIDQFNDFGRHPSK